MRSVLDILEQRLTAAMAAVTGRRDCAAIVRPATDPKFGDYQANGVMALAKKIKTNPRRLAESVVEQLDVDDICEPPEVAGPGFINLRLKPAFVADTLLKINADSYGRLGMEETAEPKRIVVDFSCPNIAKQMHVGHLRSTIIGDCICRMLEFLGHSVIRQNHIGDWGLQMGMVVYALEEEAQWRADTKNQDVEQLPDTADLSLEDFERHYKRVTGLVETDPHVADEVKARTVALHSGDDWTRIIWQRARKITLEQCYQLYKLLKVNLSNRDTRGESAYKDGLLNIVAELKGKGIAKESDGAVCVFPPGFKNKEGQPLPFIIQKSDGAYLYATTDLAALRYRVRELKADKIVYVTDARQSLHFAMLFAVADMAGWNKRNGQNVELVHVAFGSVMGEDGKPLKTRAGENVKLKDLLDEAVERARKIVEEKNPDLSAVKKEEIAKAVGIGAVKYADFSNNRTSDYVFSFDKMLAMDGNTAPYMQYAYARISSIMKKGGDKGVNTRQEAASEENPSLTEPAELDLAKCLIRYGEAIEAAVADYRPNYLTSYLYELAQKFSVFYTNCPVLVAGPDKRPTRLLLCDLTAQTIKHGLTELLGINVVKQM
jgi:arginyl-tRNA synthetase